MGTPIYMAPEQAEANPDVDHRIDIYAVGVMLYEMLAGVPPFNASSYVALVQQHVSTAPPPLGERRPDLPAQLVRAVHRALEKKPERRFADALEFSAALPSAQSLRESWEAGATVREGAAKRRRSRMLPIALASLLVGAGAVTGGVVLYQKKTTGRGQQETGNGQLEMSERRPPPTAEQAAAPEPVTAVAAAILEIDSAPRGAQVFVDGVHKGQTPLRLEGIEAGTLRLRIEARGYEELEAEKAVRPGYSESFFAVLAKRGSGREPTVTKSGRDGAGKRQPEPKREAPAPAPRPARSDDGDGKPNPYLDR